MTKVKNTKLLNDLLTQHGQGTSQNAVKAVWKIKGLDRRAGKYVGSPAQINSLIKNLKNNPVSPFSHLKDPNNPFNKSSYQGGSIVDYLSSTGQASDFGSRSKLAGQYGISGYAGTAQQNTQLLNTLRGGVQPLQPAPQVSTQQITPQTQLKPTDQVPESLAQQAQMAIQKGQQTIIQAQDYIKSRGVTPATNLQPTPTTKVDDTKVDDTKVDDTKVDDTSISDTSATAAASYLKYLDDAPTAESISNQILNSDEFKLEVDKRNLSDLDARGNAEAAKAAADVKYESDRKALENSLLENGIESSTLATTSIRALGEALAVSKLDVDRELAIALMDSSYDFKEEIYKAAADAVKDAQQGNKDAIAQLNKAGMAVMPDGTLVPTLAAQQAELSAQKEQRIAEQADVTQQMSMARLALSEAQFEFNQAKSAAQWEQAEERLAIAQNQFALALMKEQGATPTQGFFDSKIESSIREDFVELSNQNKTPEQSYKTLRALYSPQEVTDVALKELVGLTQTGEPTAEDVANDWMFGGLDLSSADFSKFDADFSKFDADFSKFDSKTSSVSGNIFTTEQKIEQLKRKLSETTDTAEKIKISLQINKLKTQ